MKLIRFGAEGNEKPGVQLEDGTKLDVSAFGTDYNEAFFGDNGIDLHIEFWMEAIDDGENRVGGDLLYDIWKLMNLHGFEFPFPQREVRLLNDKSKS